MGNLRTILVGVVLLACGVIAEAQQRAQYEAARRQLQQSQNPTPQFRDIYGGQSAPGQLNMACGQQGMIPDYVTGNCISPQGRQTNPHPKRIAEYVGNSPEVIYRNYGKWIGGADGFGSEAIQAAKPEPFPEPYNIPAGMLKQFQADRLVRGAGFEPARRFRH
jgi:hypothetical protein